MSIYKYSDFEKELRASGLSGQFSTADMALAQKNPDAGMAIISAKRNYAAAKTPEARALANAEADKVRKSYGGYTGGADGGSFNLEPLSPNSYSMPEAPVYDNAYKDRINAALSKVENGLEFSYDAASDPVYQAYDKKYTREGQLATEDVLGKASMMTGGAPSTAAITAAGQTANQYAAAKADIIPTLYQQAFERAMAEFNADRAVLSDLMGADAQEFGKYQVELGQHNTENAFNYGQLLDEIGAQADVRAEEFTKQQYADALKQQELENQRYDTQYADALKQQEIENQRYDTQYADSLKQQEIENKRYDTQYADSMKQQQFENWLVSENLKDSREQQKKQNEYTERELSRLEANADIDNAYAQEQLTQLKEGKTSDATGVVDADTYKEMKATYDAVYDSKTRDLKSKLKEILNDDTSIDIKETPEELIENILSFDTWYRLKQLGYGDYSGYKSYDEYIESEYNSIINYVTSKGGK